MNNLKKYLLMIISFVFIFMVCLFSTNTSQAATLSVDEIKKGSNVGATVRLNLNTLNSRNDLYCVQHHQFLDASNIYTYRVAKYVEIVGNDAKSGGTTVSNKDNGTLAYIISKKEGYRYGSSTGQYAMWQHINTWFSSVGGKFGLNWMWTFNDVGENSYIREGREYANRIGDTTVTEVKDETKKEDVKVTAYKNSKGVPCLRVGPFKYKFPGNIQEMSVKDQDGNKITSIAYSIYEGNEEKFVELNKIPSDKNFYISVKIDPNVTKITNISGKVKFEDTVLTARLWFLQSSGLQHLLIVDPGTKTNEGNLNFNFNYDIDLTGDIGIEKVDEDNHDLKLPGVGFIIQSKETGKYIKREGGTIKYVDTREEAEVIPTDETTGKIYVEDVLVGTYLFYEVSNPNYGYELLKDPIEVKTSSQTGKYTLITNRQIYVKLSGYVWIDKQSEKLTVRNDLYRNDTKDDEDELFEGVKVRLKDTSGNILQEKVTDSNGAYLFEDVLIDELGNYYIEFEYDGLTYENVNINLSAENGSKASEGNEREKFNNKFARVDADTRDTVSVKDSAGTETYKIKYEIQEGGHSAKIIKNQCFITANTTDAGLTITYERGKGIKELKGFNLGVYEREQTDVALMQDVDNVKVGVKGYNHIYKYGSRIGENNEPVEDAWNVGVKFRSEYGSHKYLRPVYKADANYHDETDESKDLRMFLTYKIGLKNQSIFYEESTNQSTANEESEIQSTSDGESKIKSTKINSIVDYYDKRYRFVDAGTGFDDKTGTITGSLPTKVNDITIPENEYLSAEVDTSSVLIKNKTEYVYVQFELSRQNILDLINDKEAGAEPSEYLENIAEITSYTSYADKQATQLYGSVDNDAVAGNATAGDINTYEDDTDTAPNVGLTVANARQTTGMIFEDKEEQHYLDEQNIRQGNGKYDEGESKVGNVQVQLIDLDTGKVAEVYDEKAVDEATGKLGKFTGDLCTTITGDDGSYSFTGYLPGKYVLKFTWGESDDGRVIYKTVDGSKVNYEYAVQNYKATVFEESRYNQEKENHRYYQTNTEIPQTHAIDDWETRLNIDKELNKHGTEEDNGYNHATEIKTKEMTSTTPDLEFGIEYTDTDLDNITIVDDTQVTFQVKNLDFGIIRRAIPNIEFRKRIAHMTAKLDDGSTLIDADVDEQGNLTGQTNYLTYLAPTANSNGTLRAEIDTEITQSLFVELKYEFAITNTGEADFASEGYYNHGSEYYSSRGETGEEQKEQDVVTISPSKIVDYLDSRTIYRVDNEINKQYGWQPATVEDLKANGDILDVTEEGEVSWNDKATPYYTVCLEDAKIKPKFTVGTETRDAERKNIYLVAEKTLSTNDDTHYLNQVEIVLINKTFGSRIETTPGDYTYETERVNFQMDDARAEEIVIMPSTGDNRDYIVIALSFVGILAVFGVGVYFIKKRVNK